MLFRSAGFSTAAHAQNYPNKPIKFVVPFSAGSATDNVGRIIAQAMSEAWGQPITIENKAGANGILGAEAVKAAPADGYTFLFGTNSAYAAVPNMRKEPPYDVLKDFTPVTTVAKLSFAFAVEASRPINNLAELKDYLKKKPGEGEELENANAEPPPRSNA